jgi:hypothetical protein
MGFPTRRLFAMALAGAYALAGGGVAGPAGRATAQASARSDRLFVQNASSGTLTAAAGDTLTLKLVGVPTTVWFDDRPVRKSGVEETATFAQGWHDSGTFAKQPPNAVLEGRVKGVRRAAVVELVSATFTPDTSTVEYTVRRVSQAPGFYQGHGATPKLGEGAFGSSSLFIDDASNPAGCFVQWTIPNIVNQGPQTWAGLQITSGGTFSYSFGPEIQSMGGGILYSFVAQGGNIGATGPENWFAQPQQEYFQGGGMVGGTTQFIAWFQPSSGALSLTGTVLGAGATPTANAPSAFTGACPKVEVSNNPGASYPFTITFGSN